MLTPKWSSLPLPHGEQFKSVGICGLTNSGRLTWVWHRVEDRGRNGHMQAGQEALWRLLRCRNFLERLPHR